MRSSRQILLLARNPVKRESPYTWLGKRYYAILEILDGIESFFGGRNHYGHRAMDFVFWEAETQLKREIGKSHAV